MLADRENWAEAPLRLDGSPGALWLGVERLTRLVGALKPWGQLTTVTSVAIHRSQGASRAGYALAGLAHPRESGPGTEEVWKGAFGALVAAGHLPAVWDSRSPAPPGVKLAVLTSSVCLDASEGRQLQRFVAEGGAILAIGVSVEKLGNARRTQVASGRILELNSVTEMAAAFDRLGLRPAVMVDAAAALPILARSPGSDVVFLVRPASEPEMVSMRFSSDADVVVRSLIGDDPEIRRGQGGEFRLLMPGRSVQVFSLRWSQRGVRARLPNSGNSYDGPDPDNKAANEQMEL
jgi:hypothetical protein